MKMEERLTYPRGHSGDQPSFTREAIHARDSMSLSAADAPLPFAQFAQAMLDVTGFIFCFLFVVFVLASPFLAVGLMIFAHY